MVLAKELPALSLRIHRYLAAASAAVAHRFFADVAFKEPDAVGAPCEAAATKQQTAVDLSQPSGGIVPFGWWGSYSLVLAAAADRNRISEVSKPGHPPDANDCGSGCRLAPHRLDGATARGLNKGCRGSCLVLGNSLVGKRRVVRFGFLPGGWVAALLEVLHGSPELERYS